jgi:ABC-type sugar transport system ATPase subunit
MNLLPARVTAAAGGIATVTVEAKGTSAVDLGAPGVAAGDRVTIGVRPEAIAAYPADAALPAGMTALPARVESVERLGNIAFAYLDAGTPEVVTVQLMSHSDLRSGSEVNIGLRPTSLHLFNASGDAVLHATAT